MMTNPEPNQMTGQTSNGFESLIPQQTQPAPIPQPPTAEAAPQPVVDNGEKVFGEKYVRELREEAKTNRLELQKAIADAETKAQQAAEQAANAAKEELTRNLGKALGLVTDDTPVDPEVLVSQAKQAQIEAERAAEQAKAEAAAQVQAAQEAAKQKAIEADLYRRAAAAGADPTALLDSRSFMDRADVKGLDPSAADYASQLDAVIKNAVETEPTRYRAAARIAAVPRSGGDFAAGSGDPTSGADTSPKTVEERIKAKLEAGGRKGIMHKRFVGGRAHGETMNGMPWET